MPEQFENPETTKLEEETSADASAEKKIQQIADKAAGKAAKTEHKYDKDHNLFSK